MPASAYVAVVGAGEADAGLRRSAEQVGAELARRGAVLICGGLGGVMEAACRGAQTAGGTTVGLLPGTDRNDANEWVSVAVATGLGELRNGLVVRASDALIAVGGGFGTLSEVGFALKLGKPVIGLGTWELAQAGRPADRIVVAPDPPAAVELAIRHIG